MKDVAFGLGQELVIKGDLLVKGRWVENKGVCGTSQQSCLDLPWCTAENMKTSD